MERSLGVEALLRAADEVGVAELLRGLVKVSQARFACIQEAGYPEVAPEKFFLFDVEYDLLKAALVYQVGREKAELLIEGAMAVMEE